jgi:uncharacterized LabA/DUF88 family protein
MPAATTPNSAQLQLAVFIDFENLALGLRDGDPPFDVRRILDRLLEKGKVIAKVAYADWNRFRNYTTPLHENGIELIEIPRRSTTGKNSADIRLVVDAMDLSWSKSHIDTFVIVSGDSDFSPLVAKLKENGKHVIGLGMKASTSPLLANMCDEFIYYEDLEHRHRADKTTTKPAGDSDEAFRLLADTVRALQRENFEVIQASLVKDTLKRKRPAFSEAALGYGSFSEMLEDAARAGVLTLRRDERSGTYQVSAVAGRGGRATRESHEPAAESRAVAPEARPATAAAERRPRAGGRGRGRGRTGERLAAAEVAAAPVRAGIASRSENLPLIVRAGAAAKEEPVSTPRPRSRGRRRVRTTPVL